MKRKLSVPEQHQLRVARKTLNMPDAILNYLNACSGGMTKDEARQVVAKLTGVKAKRKIAYHVVQSAIRRKAI